MEDKAMHDINNESLCSSTGNPNEYQKASTYQNE